MAQLHPRVIAKRLRFFVARADEAIADRAEVARCHAEIARLTTMLAELGVCARCGQELRDADSRIGTLCRDLADRMVADAAERAVGSAAYLVRGDLS